MRRCAVVMCPNVSGPRRLCPSHQLDFEASPEGKNLRAGSLTDFINRTWKENQAVRAEAKWADATPEQRAAWSKGNFGK